MFDISEADCIGTVASVAYSSLTLARRSDAASKLVLKKRVAIGNTIISQSMLDPLYE